MRRLCLILPVLMLVLLSQATPFASPPPTASDLETRIAAIVPKPAEEQWLQIPWRTNLMQVDCFTPNT